MNNEIKEILDKLSNRKHKPLINGLRDCQLKNIEHPFITKEEYIDKILDYITNLQQENKILENKLINIENNLRGSIYGITDKLIIDKIIPIVKDGITMNLNKYQIVRLKGIRTKCKELLRIIEGD